MSAPLLEIQLGDIISMRKPHPCGGADWVVTRVGADIGLQCTTCQHRIMLSRAKLEPRVKKIRRHP